MGRYAKPKDYTYQDLPIKLLPCYHFITPVLSPRLH